MTTVRAILDFPEPGGTAVRSTFAAPVQVVAAHRIEDVRPALRAVEAAVASGLTAVGFVAYEAAPAFDPALVTGPAGPLPLLWFALFDHAVAADPPAFQPPAPLRWFPDTDRTTYDAAIRDIRELIAAGDVYQVNHTIRFRAACAREPLRFYDALVAARHGVYHALIETADWAVVSASPELFFELRAGVITTRPMKGTIRRGRWLEEDRLAAQQLAHSAKDRAENLMIVDLLRNDLGRIAEFGSVTVPRIFDIETYPTVHQLTSTVTARTRAVVSLDDVFTAMFPCGSVTGAPKVTAMRAIARLEHTPRGVYCGAIGIVRPDGSATFNVAIRTLTIDRHTHDATYGAGGGITWDSHAAAEYDEVIAKAALLADGLPEFSLLETMRLDGGVYARLSLHLARLRDSARYWQFPGNAADRAAAALAQEQALAPTGSWRVRMTVTRTGVVDIARTPLLPDATSTRPVAVCTQPVSSHDRLLFHKTTARMLYDTRSTARPDVFDVLLVNEDGFITEFTNGNVVAEIDGVLLTPARSCGLLAGTFRQYLLNAGTIQETVIPLADLQRASRLWFINSVREWLEVVLVE